MKTWNSPLKSLRYLVTWPTSTNFGLLPRGRLLRCRQWSDSVDTESIVSGVPENMGVAVGIMRLGTIEVETRWGEIFPPQLQHTYVKILEQ